MFKHTRTHNGEQIKQRASGGIHAYLISNVNYEILVAALVLAGLRNGQRGTRLGTRLVRLRFHPAHTNSALFVLYMHTHIRVCQLSTYVIKFITIVFAAFFALCVRFGNRRSTSVSVIVR